MRQVAPTVEITMEKNVQLVEIFEVKIRRKKVHTFQLKYTSKCLLIQANFRAFIAIISFKRNFLKEHER